MRIGLLGGSFNPPHRAHRLISETALKRLNLAQVWWIVTPGNPLKDHADLAPLAERLPRAAFVQGANTAGVLLYRDRFPNQVIFTDDGTAGRQGFPTEWVEEQARRKRLAMVYTCGPEAMMAAVADVCRRYGVGCQVSMERYMKCGIGVCGQCDCDGRRVCVEGPTFSLEELADMPSFGRIRRDRTGRRIDVAGAEQCPSAPRAPHSPGG
jgi:hypothetical protein